MTTISVIAPRGHRRLSNRGFALPHGILATASEPWLARLPDADRDEFLAAVTALIEQRHSIFSNEDVRLIAREVFADF